MRTADLYRKRERERERESERERERDRERQRHRERKGERENIKFVCNNSSRGADLFLSAEASPYELCVQRP